MKRWNLLTLILYVLLIFFVSSRPYLQPPGPDFPAKDKVIHACEYGVLGMLLFRAVGWRVSRKKLTTFLFLIAVAASVAALDELFQSYIPGRMMDVLDWTADVTGASLGLIFMIRRKARREMKGTSP